MKESTVLHCLIWLLVYGIIGAIFLYIVELLLGHFGALPPPIPVLIRALVAVILLVWLLWCLGLLAEGPSPRIRP